MIHLSQNVLSQSGSPKKCVLLALGNLVSTKHEQERQQLPRRNLIPPALRRGSAKISTQER